MTRTRTHAYGVVTPSSRQPLLEAMLRAFCWLVSNVAWLFGPTINRHTRDWHMDEAEDDHLPTPNDPIQKEAQTSQPSFSGKRKARVPGIPVASSQGTASHSRCATNQDAWHKAEHDSLDDQEAEPQLRVPRLRGGHGLRHTRSLPAHPDESRDPGRTSNLVPPCSFNPAYAAHPFSDSDASSRACRRTSE